MIYLYIIIGLSVIGLLTYAYFTLKSAFKSPLKAEISEKAKELDKVNKEIDTLYVKLEDNNQQIAEAIKRKVSTDDIKKSYRK